MDDNEDLKAIYAAARSIQSAAAQAVAELAQLVADNRAIPGQIAQQAGRTAQEVPQLVKQSADQALACIADGAEKAIRKAAVTDVGAKIEAAMTGPMATIDEALRKLKSSADQAEYAASKWKFFARVFRWQQLAIAVLAGIAIGGAGTWYFASRPLKEAADYILWLKERPAPSADTGHGGAEGHSRAAHGAKPKASQETQPPAVDNQEQP
ncbi:MAG: hypothetical protein WB421_17240 [Terriglobales bacterium]